MAKNLQTIILSEIVKLSKGKKAFISLDLISKNDKDRNYIIIELIHSELVFVNKSTVDKGIMITSKGIEFLNQSTLSRRQNRFYKNRGWWIAIPFISGFLIPIGIDLFLLKQEEPELPGSKKLNLRSTSPTKPDTSPAFHPTKQKDIGDTLK